MLLIKNSLSLFNSHPQFIKNFVVPSVVTPICRSFFNFYSYVNNVDLYQKMCAANFSSLASAMAIEPSYVLEKVESEFYTSMGGFVQGVSEGLLISGALSVSAVALVNFFLIAAALVLSYAAICDCFRIYTNQLMVNESLEMELLLLDDKPLYMDAFKTHNFFIDKRVRLNLYKAGKVMELASSVWSLALAAVTLLQACGLIVLSSSAAVSFVGVGALLFFSSWFVENVLDVEGIKRNYLVYYANPS